MVKNGMVKICILELLCDGHHRKLRINVGDGIYISFTRKTYFLHKECMLLYKDLSEKNMNGK